MRRVVVRRGTVRLGEAVEASYVPATNGWLWLVLMWQSWQVLLRNGRVSRGKLWPFWQSGRGEKRRGIAWLVLAWQSRRGMFRSGGTRHVKSSFVLAVLAGYGVAGSCTVWLGLTGQLRRVGVIWVKARYVLVGHVSQGELWYSALVRGLLWQGWLGW